MFDKYRGLILTCTFIAIITYFGYRTEKNLTNSVHKLIEEKQTGITENDNNVALNENQNSSSAEQNINNVLEENNSHNLNPSQVEEIVKNYLVKNPQIIADALDNLQQIKMDEMKKQVQEQIVSRKSELETTSSSFIGNPEGKSHIVMFFDYNCGYCKQSADAIESLLENNSNIKVVLKHYPILGNESEFLSRLALAVNKNNPSKFRIIHNEFISNKVFSKEDLVKLFKEHNLDYDKLETLGESQEITDQIKANISLAKDLRINGVPAFVINGQYYPGFLTAEQLMEKVKTPAPVSNSEEKELPILSIEDDFRSNNTSKEEEKK